LTDSKYVEKCVLGKEIRKEKEKENLLPLLFGLVIHLACLLFGPSSRSFGLLA
jgi:hypothetical protein